MHDLTIDGHWWLPSDPGHRAHGVLTVKRGSCSLRLHEQLERFQMPASGVGVGRPEWIVHEIVYGLSWNGEEVTLLGVAGHHLPGPFTRVDETRSVDFVVAGGHAASGVVAKAMFEFDYLLAWVQPPSVIDRDDDPDLVSLRLGSVALHTASVGGDEYEVVGAADYHLGEDEVRVVRRCMFQAVPAQPLSLPELLSSYVRPLHDLVTLTLGRSVRLTALLVWLEDGSVPLPLNVHFDALQVAEQEAASTASVLSYTAPTLWTLGGPYPPRFTDLLPRWFELRDELAEVMPLLLSVHYSDFMYAEHRFASVFQSVEAYCKVRYKGPQKSKQGHRARVDAVVAVLDEARLPPETVSWARSIIASRNDKKLSELVDGLLDDSGAIGQRITAASPTFSALVASTRAGVSHGGAAVGLKGTARWWYGEALRWLLRARLLVDLGIEPARVEETVLGRGGFTRAVSELRSHAEALGGEHAPTEESQAEPDGERRPARKASGKGSSSTAPATRAGAKNAPKAATPSGKAAAKKSAIKSARARATPSTTTRRAGTPTTTGKKATAHQPPAKATTSAPSTKRKGPSR